MRYLLHDNDAGDSGYSEWLQEFIDLAVLPFAKPPSRILDFGSGPVPYMGNMLAKLGFAVSMFDPFFAPSTAWEKEKFDLILMHEVFEHLVEPGITLKRLLPHCSPGGRMCIRTRLLPVHPERFDAWWYRSDLTHVGFIARETISYIASFFNLEPEYENGKDIIVFKTAGTGLG